MTSHGLGCVNFHHPSNNLMRSILSFCTDRETGALRVVVIYTVLKLPFSLSLPSMHFLRTSKLCSELLLLWGPQKIPHIKLTDPSSHYIVWLWTSCARYVTLGLLACEWFSGAWHFFHFSSFHLSSHVIAEAWLRDSFHFYIDLDSCFRIRDLISPVTSDSSILFISTSLPLKKNFNFHYMLSRGRTLLNMRAYVSQQRHLEIHKQIIQFLLSILVAHLNQNVEEKLCRANLPGEKSPEWFKTTLWAERLNLFHLQCAYVLKMSCVKEPHHFTQLYVANNIHRENCNLWERSL